MPARFTVRASGNAAIIECWDRARSLTRRATVAGPPTRGRLALVVERFGGREAKATLADLGHPSNTDLPRQAEHGRYLEEFRRALRRQFAGWAIDEITAGADLEHSLSPAYARGYLRRGSTGIAVIGAGAASLDADGILTFGLIWLDRLRETRKESVEALVLFVPAGREEALCHRVRHLDRRAATCLIFAQDGSGLEDRADPADYTNLATQVVPALAPRQDTLSAGPEADLERLVLAKATNIDASLRSSPVYSQVLHYAGSQRGVADLLAVDRDGRLCVLELKVSEDIHLPMQALDYWMRVRWHNERGDLKRAGYFPGIELRPEPPRLILVAPALHWHPTSERLLRYLPAEAEVQRIGLAEDWRRDIRIMFRK